MLSPQQWPRFKGEKRDWDNIYRLFFKRQHCVQYEDISFKHFSPGREENFVIKGYSTSSLWMRFILKKALLSRSQTIPDNNKKL